MKAFTRFALALAVVAIALAPALAVERDPAPIVADDTAPDGRYFAAVFLDMIEAPQTVCENGVCRVVGPAPAVASARAADCPCGSSCPCGAPSQPASASARSRPLLFDRVRSWYPGKLFQSFRVGRAAARGFCN